MQNIKLGFRIQSKVTKDSIFKKLDCPSLKTFHNFFVLRKQFVYTIFWAGSYINVTKIPDYKDIEKAVDYISNILDIVPIDIKIHNICSSGSLEKNLQLRTLSQSLKSEYRTSFNTHFFPALFLRRKFEPTIVLFQNGKYSIIGAKSEEQSRNSLIFLKNVLASNHYDNLS